MDSLRPDIIALLANFAVFESEDKLNHMKQSLTVQWLAEDSISFSLVAISDLCTFTQDGLAAVVDDKEYDVDEDGVGYLIKQFQVAAHGKLWRLRIAEPERDKARIIYLHDDPRDECAPFDHIMRVRGGK